MKKLTAILIAAVVAVSMCVTVFADYCVVTYPDVSLGSIAVEGSHENPSTSALCSNSYREETVVKTISLAGQRFGVKEICTARNIKLSFEVYELKCTSCGHIFALMLRAE